MSSPDQAIADVSRIGGYFHLYTDDAPPGPWQPLRRLLTDEAAFAHRVAVTAERLGTAETRVAASILYLGIATRFWSPVLGAAVVHRVLLDWTADTSERPVTDLVQAAEPLYRAVSALLEPLAGLVLL